MVNLLLIVLILTVVNNGGFTEAIQYRKCADSSFCRRCRNVERNSEIYTLQVHTLQIKNDSIQVDMINKHENKILILKLEAIKNNTFRFQIDEKSPLHSRYRVHDVLKGPPNLATLKVENQTESEIVVTSENNKAIISIRPFEIDFYHNNNLLISVNSRGLFHFEHLRNFTKHTGYNHNDVSGDWGEYFLSFFDSKPNGPEAIALDFVFPKSKIFYGIPQHSDSLVLKSTRNSEPYRLYNVDVPLYELNSKKAMYGSVPILYGHGPYSTVGVFWHNSAETWIDIITGNRSESEINRNNRKKISISARFMSESGIIDVFILLGPKPSDTFKQYTDLTGTTNLPQLYTLGYHQSRWNYLNEDVIKDIINDFDGYDIPIDTIWLDMEYSDNKKLFTWNKNFPNPLLLIENLRNRGHHIVLTLGSHILIDNNYKLHKDSQKNNYYVKTNYGCDYKAWSWFGHVNFLDYFNPTVRSYWSNLYQSDNFKTITNDVMIWNNMNEPSIFSGPEGTMVKDLIHYNQIEHRNLHNLYGHMNVLTIYNSIIKRDPNQRPFILTRSHFSGTQRYAAISMGENYANWTYLKSSIQMCLTESVAGFSFCGADIGGCFGNPDEELIERWYQAAIYQPFFRSHSSFLSIRREPWRFSIMTVELIRLAIRKRYSYLPFWYTMFYEHEIYGLPIMRPLFVNYPADIKTYDIDTQYLLQNHLLICPIFEKSLQTINVYFPQDYCGIWYDIETYKKYNTSEYKNISVHKKSIPVFQRGGTIIPKKERIRRTSILMANDPYTLIICLDDKEYAKGTLYIDDEKTYDYRIGKFIYVEYEFKENQLINRFLNNPNYLTKSWLERIVIAGLKNIPISAELEIYKVNNESTKLLIINNQNFITIRNPKVKLTNNFGIKLKF